MFWISAILFVVILMVLLSLYFLIVPGWIEKKEIKVRLSLLELRNLLGEDLPDVLKSELLSDVPTLNKILANFKLAVRIDKRLRQANMEMKVGTFVLLIFFLFGFGIVVGGFLHWYFLICILFGAILALVPIIVINIKRNLRMKKFIMYFPEALEMFARSLRAGHSFTGAIQLVGQEMPDPIGPEFQKVFDEQNLGIPLRNALIAMMNRIDILDVRFFVTAILIQRETGGNLAEIIDKISYVIRERFRVQGQLKIYTAQARLTGMVLSSLPIGVAFILYALSPGYMKPLWEESVGRSMIVAAVILQITGMLVIRKIIRIKI
jgi:tight adherence protein B